MHKNYRFPGKVKQNLPLNKGKWAGRNGMGR